MGTCCNLSVSTTLLIAITLPIAQCISVPSLFAEKFIAASSLPHTRSFNRDAHVHMLKDAIARIPDGLPQHLSTSVPWTLYWCTHALDVLGERDWVRKPAVRERLLQVLKSCWNDVDGGFRGGDGCDSHACATYAAMCTLVILGERPAWLKTEQLLEFLARLKKGSKFHSTLYEDVDDVRVTYCALAAGSLLPGGDHGRLAVGCDRFLSQLQTYEGGLSGTPDGEAHAGYTYCAVAAATITGRPQLYDARQLLSWLATKQTSVGGLQGRTNKLPDTCYTFWLGGALAVLAQSDAKVHLPYNLPLIVEYVLACQSPEGGFSDHPLDKPDLYHTCYALSGLATMVELHRKAACPVTSLLLDSSITKLRKVDPVYNICQDTLQEWRDHGHGA